MARLLLRAVLMCCAAIAVCHGSRVSSALTLGAEDKPNDATIKDSKPNLSMREELRTTFGSWAKLQGKEYAAKPSANGDSGELLGEHAPEYAHRFNIFERNWHFVQRLIEMKANSTWELSVTGPFMDLEAHEFNTRLGYAPELEDLDAEPTEPILSSEDAMADFMYRDAELKTVDWREKGAVSEIKDQGQCGSCWSFSTTGVLEGVNAINTGNLVSLSEQELVSCDPKDKGCNGGEMTLAYRWIMANGGLVPEKDYPYVSGPGSRPECNGEKLNDDTKVTLSGFKKVPVGHEAGLQKATMFHPVSVAVNANQWQFYGGGVFQGLFGFCNPTTLNHGVLVVGFNAEEEYYIIKNSWGTVWGEQGYMRIAANKGKFGLCGLTRDASWPTQDS